MQGLLDAIVNEDTANSILKLSCFIQYASRLRNEILLAQQSSHLPNIVPQFLPVSIIKFLASSCILSEQEVEECWKVVKEIVWSACILDDKAVSAAFKNHGADKGFISARNLWPPSQLCTNPDCKRTDNGRKLQIATQREGILYTLNEGPIPIHSCFLTCKDCKTDYHLDFYVKNERRFYYDNPPDIFQIADHQFIERHLIDMWRTSTNIAWVSFANCAAVYLNTHKTTTNDKIPESWKFKGKLDGKNVAHAFILLALLEDHQQRNTILQVPHGGLQSERYKVAMHERNDRIRLYGQPELRHRCQKCVREYVNDGCTGLTVHAVVMDGVTLGRPTCGVPHCTLPLANKRHRFCPTHVHFNEKCAIVGCSERISAPDKRTCNNPIHQQVENVHVERGQAAFQLKEKLKRAKVAHPKNGEALDLPVAHIIEQGDDLDETYEIVGDRVIPSEADPVTQTALARASLNPTIGTSVTNPITQAPVCGLTTSKFLLPLVV